MPIQKELEELSKGLNETQLNNFLIIIAVIPPEVFESKEETDKLIKLMNSVSEPIGRWFETAIRE